MRVAPLLPEEWDDNVIKALSGFVAPERMERREAGTALATMARNPKLTRSFLRFNGYLLFSSTLPADVRELAILRVAHRRGCEYEWVHHVEMAQREGITLEAIEQVQRGEADDALGRAIIAAVDELETDSNVSDATWAALSEHLDEQQRMDLVFTIGCYGLLAMAFNTFGVVPEQEN
ncbi:carboxymuconolactone decarboxylase family protein [Mycobacterium sp. OTB74]|uniref:carboxymuconolactone decarboxylase family protein n=1 Tax=Mycobacterium sp. OTB74 TaxID=1853452 RepID=UPI0024746812|nr:carboxymuconolactone decarboxylase family protein [Mycobacterium sp. OTB74]MDH6245270.1 4-carboxymuconolactone decarboxylase [Mycobacterium sp. OTB74]